ncbi:hypothetical protein GGS23DRAFT_526547 [Durotheca rogersii]|uniref:uncharacterized protein n=1 Tax=Durotheca rogersii TaxID=419775 RepID=UPI00221FFBF9|nr:uncharacterized protein GGS23DRAFT_526547 [Durotheca rogersii]KAI5863302.1 hypothetical protein GGS23DRAFT_526547 [Durotheca rogersii]
MPSLLSLAASALLLARSLHAHFTVQHPPIIGPFNAEEEDSAPCGGHSPDLNTLPANDFHVDGDAIATTLTHSQSTWLYRVTTDATASGNWTQIWGIVDQQGAGAFCIPQISVPHSFIGQKVILSIVSHATDGFLYQCSALNFVEGIATAPSDCRNGSNTQGSFSSDAELTAMLGDGPVGSSASPSGSSPTDVPSGGTTTKPGGSEGRGVVFTVGLMAVLGSVLAV